MIYQDSPLESLFTLFFKNQDKVGGRYKNLRGPAHFIEPRKIWEAMAPLVPSALQDIQEGIG